MKTSIFSLLGCNTFSLVDHFMLIFIVEDCKDLVLSGVRFRLAISVYSRCYIWLVDLQFSFSVAIVHVVVVSILSVNVLGV